LGIAVVAAAAAGALWTRASRREADLMPKPSDSPAPADGMRLRDFGATGMKVSETGFGAWAIGGQAYGAVDRAMSLDALARAEELGCNFVDTAMVYGDSELVLGEFLRGRRDRWLVATKYSGQEEGMERVLEQQLQRLGTDRIDFYMVHWAPDASEQSLYEDLYRLRKSGKVRAVGVSLKTANDIDRVLDSTEIDGFMVRFSLLDPDPFLARLRRIREKRPAIIVRSALREGFLTGKFKRDATFPDPNDQRHALTPEQVAELVDKVERFRFLESEGGSMAVAAARYPLSFPEVSTVILGTKNRHQADSNFGSAPGRGLSAESLARILELQNDMGLRTWRTRITEALRDLF
jgi:aryl-alcohol dehydrogenase-like predicted oxidoreductase